MRLWPIAVCVIVLQVSACSPSVNDFDSPRPKPPPIDETGRPPAPGASPTMSGEDSEALSTMRIWLRNFRDAQDIYRGLGNRYADDVTVGGKIYPLPKPYRTYYDAHQVWKSYWVKVYYPKNSLACRLEDGEDVSNTGKIICQRE